MTFYDCCSTVPVKEASSVFDTGLHKQFAKLGWYKWACSRLVRLGQTNATERGMVYGTSRCSVKGRRCKVLVTGLHSPMISSPS